jgi:XTP/dITP diphosphohydrolase
MEGSNVENKELNRLVFATNNQHKLKEIRHAAGEHIHLLSLADIGFTGDIPEEEDTIEGNAAQKAWFIYNRYSINCFADDTGLEIDALDGEPGVYSARYAGENCSFEDNMNKVLAAMEGIENRKARFRTVIALVENGKLTTFQGEIQGVITRKKFGVQGFGYDPVFLPEGFDRTFAEMDLAEKNRISHRALAVQKLIDYLTTRYK